MSPLVAYSNLVAAVTATVITIIIFAHLRDMLRKDPIARNFLAFFALLGVFFWLVSLNGLIIHSVRNAAVIVRISNFILFPATAFFITVPLRIFGAHPIVKKIILIIFILSGAVLFLLDTFVFLQSSEIKEIDERFYVYISHHKPFISILNGFIPMITALIGSVFFIFLGIRSLGPEQYRLKMRSLLIGIGMFNFMVASILYYFILSILFLPVYLIAASALSVIGFILMGVGILLTKSEPTPSPEEEFPLY